MARTFRLLKGDPAAPSSPSPINLINTAATGWIFQRGQAGRPRFPIPIEGTGRVTESWAIRLKGASQDAAATEVQNFIKLLRDAWAYHNGNRQREPVYIEQQATSETSARYALVFAAPELEWPDLFDFPFEGDAEIESLELAIVREHPWSSHAPGDLPTATTLGASDGPASPKMVHLANFRDDGNLSHVFSDDGGVFSGNLISAGSGTALWPAVPAVGDALYFGSTDIPFKHICLALAQAGNQVWDLVLEYHNGTNWDTVQTLGTHFTLFQGDGTEITSLDDWMNGSAADAVKALRTLSYFPPSNWATVAVNAVTAFWVRLRVTAFTSGATIPQKNADAIYAQRTNYIEVPAAALVGDSNPLSLIRLWAPSGGDENPRAANLSRILVGAKSEGISGDPEDFVFSLNLGNVDNPTPWATTYGTDTAAAADNGSQGGQRARCDFATDATDVMRVRLVGTAVLDHWVGTYQLMVRLRQNGGGAGDCRASARILFGGSAVKLDHIDTRQERTTGFGEIEVLNLGIVRLPAADVFSVDSLAGTDVVIEIFSERTTGASSLDYLDVMLLPVLEEATGADDPVSDTVNGPSALRGGTVLDLDAGVLATRTQKFRVESGGTLVPASEWSPMGDPIPFERLATKTRLYFLLLHYTASGGWQAPPLGAQIGVHLAAELYLHTSYALLRGSS